MKFQMNFTTSYDDVIRFTSAEDLHRFYTEHGCDGLELMHMLASKLPHKRECREAIQPLISQRIQGEAIDKEIRRILLGLDDTDTHEYSEEKYL